MQTEKSERYTTVGLDPVVRDRVNTVRDELGFNRVNDVIEELIRRRRLSLSQDSLNRKINEFDVENSDEAILELIRYHDILPEWVDSRKDLIRLVDALPYGTEDVIKNEEISDNKIRASDLCDVISEETVSDG